MTTNNISFSVFTKPWKMPVPELARFVSGLGFDAIELPVRPGFQVEPQNVAKGLPQAVKQLADCGIKIASVAGPTDEATIATCAEVGIPVIRVMAWIGNEPYLAAEARIQREYDALLPLLERYGVKLGVQNHCDRFVANACGMRALVGKYDPRQIGIVWDAAHNALQGEDLDYAIDIVWSHLCMVNLKNAFWVRATGPEAEDVRWKTYWTSGRQGLASWPLVAAELKRRDYAGVVCLTAEYSDEHSVDRLIAEDIAFAKSIFA